MVVRTFFGSVNEMNTLNDIEVIINNKRYTLSGYECEEYLQKVASYINSKHTEFKNKDAYKLLDADMKNILIQINIADDYFRIKKHVKEIEDENDVKGNEIFDMKHEVISTQSKLDSALKEIEDLKREINDTQKNVVRLETELNDAEKQR